MTDTVFRTAMVFASFVLCTHIQAMKDGERCTVYYPNGERYRGEWSANKKEGKGTISYKNGNKYEGGFKMGQRHGQGTLWINEEGKFRVLYTGQWYEGRKQGYGVCVSKNGDRYEGEWLKVRSAYVHTRTHT